MNNTVTIGKKELKSYFVSPVAYIVIVVFLAIVGYFFTSNLFLAGVVSMRNVLEMTPFVFLFYIPAISMRTFSEEKKTGTIELLLTRPITDSNLVLGKFFATLGLAVITLIPTVVYVISLTTLGPLDMGPVLCAYLGLIFMAALYISIGLWTSSLTENQVVAFILSFLIIFILFMLDKILPYLPAGIASILEYISTGSHYGNMARGVIDTRDLIYYISGITIFLTLTKLSLEKRKW